MQLVTKTITTLLIGVLVGILFARQLQNNYVIILQVSALCLLVSVRFRQLFWLSLIGVGVCIGMYRSQPILDAQSAVTSLVGDKVTVEGAVINDPVYHSTGQYEFLVESPDMRSTFKIRSFINALERGDEVAVTGKLYDGFAYWQGSMQFADTVVTAKEDSFLSSFRARFISNVYSAVPDPEASLGLGFLIGIRALLPDSLTEQLSITGLTHIIAVSGYNLTILVGLSQRLFLRFSRFQSLCFSALLLISFITVTGLSPSILRATVVSSASLVAWYFARHASPLRLLLYSSAISAFIRPSYVWYDIGWYLSLTAFFGVLVVAPLLKQLLFGDKELRLMGQIVLETSCAQLCTMQIVMLVFEEVSVIALLANALILPLIPLAMLATFVVGSVYFVSWWLAGIVALPAYWLLAFIVSVVAWLSRFDWALVGASMTFVQAVATYLLLVFLVVFGYKKLSKRSSSTTDLLY